MVSTLRFFSVVPTAAAMSPLVTADLRDKFRGAMVGAVLGDALGAPLEFRSQGSLSLRRVLRQFEVYSKSASPGDYFYTDDTAMARQLADSLAEQGGMDEKASWIYNVGSKRLTQGWWNLGFNLGHPTYTHIF